MLRTEEEKAADQWEVEALLDLAFGPGRVGLSAYRLREGVNPVARLCLVARDRLGTIVGTIRFWPVCVGDRPFPALLLGPIAVHPTRQGEGIGRTLIGEGIDRARRQGWRLIFLVGDAPYYERMGFRRCHGVSFPPPTDPERLLYLELSTGAFEGASGLIRRWPGSGNPLENL